MKNKGQRPGIRLGRWLFLAGAWAAAFTFAGLVSAHWIPPEEIVARLQGDPQLREQAGVRHVRRDGRLLVITVDPTVWARLAAPERLRLANEWHQVWSHNVPEGVVGVVSSKGEKPLVNYNARGEARLLEEQ